MPQQISERVRQRIIYAKLTGNGSQKEIARGLGIAHSTVSRVLKAERLHRKAVEK